MTTDEPLIARAGRALYGERWQTELARALGVHKDTVQDWRQGRSQPRPGVYVDMLRLVVERQADLDDVADALRRLDTPTPPAARPPAR